MSVELNVLKALMTLFTAAFPDVEVIFGEPVTKRTGDYLCVGWSPQGGPSASASEDWDSVGQNATRLETFDIPCYLDTTSGDNDPASVIVRWERADILYSTVQSTVRANKTLSGATGTGWAQTSSREWYSTQSNAGLAVGVIFHITGEAWI